MNSARPASAAPIIEPKPMTTHAPGAHADPHAAKMDDIYRWMRHIYDVTRKFYLFGRDTLLANLNAPQGSVVIEVGCGTARNLVKLSKKRPDLRLYGLDASSQMLETASKKLVGPLAQRITLKQGLAEQLDPAAMFGIRERIDRIFFSYSLTMIPPWKGSIDAALRAIPVGEEIHIVDFWDQASWPGPTRWALRRWLKLFTVEFRPELMTYLQQLAAEKKVKLEVISIMGRYAFRAKLTRLA